MKQALTGAKVFDGETLLEGMAVVIDGEHICGVEDIAQLEPSINRVDLAGGILSPGFVDLQVNGGGGVLFNNDTTVEAIKTILAAHRASGTTSLLPTLISDTLQRHKAGAAAVAAAVEAGMTGVLGLHIEGPFFNAAKRGAHKASYIRSMTDEDLNWLGSLQGFKVLVTLAPECVKGGQIKQLSAAGITVCAGHSDATYAQIMRGVKEGLKGFTHLFNAMRPLQGREPGVVGAALATEDTWCGVIVDGHHVHEASIRIAQAAKKPGKLYLVSDAMATVGAAEKSFQLYGELLREEDGCLINAEGRLAGSAIGMIDAVRITHTQVGFSLEESLKMAALYPAQFMGLDHRIGRIKSNFRADLVHFDEDFVVQNTWSAGAHQSH